MFKIGLTGGIGSGKTTIANIFASLGVPVYNADDKAKYLMQNDKKLIDKIKKLLGESAYHNQQLNTKYIGQKVFSDHEMLIKLEMIVHPAVKKDFNNWAKKQDADYVIMENAILHKSRMDKLVDYVILVKASAKIRAERVKKRDKLSDIEIQKRLAVQDNEEKLLKKSNYIIKNNVSNRELIKKIEKFDSNLKKMLKKS